MRWWGKDASSRLELDCSTPPVTGAPVVNVGGGVASVQKLPSSGIADDAVLGNHLRALDDLLFGYPNDGEFTADGTTDGTAFGLGVAGSPGAGNYKLSRDVNLRRLTVLSGVTVATQGFKLIAQYLELQGTSVIENDGAVGGVGGPGSAGVGGTRGQQATSGGSVPNLPAGDGSIGCRLIYGTDGGNGGNAGLVGNPGQDQVQLIPALGGKGGLGSAGDAATTPGVLGGGGGRGSTAVTAPKTSPYYFPSLTMLWDPTQLCGIGGGNSGTGGGGGGSNASGNEGGGGAGGGQGGGVCVVICGTLVLTNWTGRISANGGDGGNGGAKNGTGGLGGIGGEGGGGLCVVVFRKVVGQYVTQAVVQPAAGTASQAGSFCANSGGKAATGGNSTWTAAGAGTVIVVNLSQPASPAGENGDALMVARPARPQLWPASWFRHHKNF